jgi:hypothetical protein
MKMKTLTEQIARIQEMMGTEKPMGIDEQQDESMGRFELDSHVYVDIEEFIVTINVLPHGEGTCDFRIKLSEGRLKDFEIGINDSDIPDEIMLAEFHKYYNAGKFKNFPIHMTWDMETGECGTD